MQCASPLVKSNSGLFYQVWGSILGGYPMMMSVSILFDLIDVYVLFPLIGV